MERITFRFDDVSPNTDLFELSTMSGFLYGTFSCDLWYAMNIFGKSNEEGSVYPGVPFKDKDIPYFYDVDIARTSLKIPGKIVSHGLLHSDHARMDYGAQEMSIVTSCRFLKTSTFVPPFNRWNTDTSNACMRNGIHLVTMLEGWKSLEHNEFDPSHKLWYLHPWKWTLEKLKEKVCVSKVMGQLQGNAL